MTWLGIVGEDKQGSCHEQHDAHNQQAAAKNFLHLILKEKAHDAHGNHRHEDIEEILGLVVHLELEQTLQYPVNFAPQDDEGAEHRSHMDQNGKREVIGALDAKQITTDGQMATTAHG